MNYNRHAYVHVERQLGALIDELHTLQHELAELQSGENIGLNSDPDLTGVCERVSAAADAVVSVVEAWIPSLVPTRRELDELLQTIASWQPNASTQRAAVGARKLFEQLKANTYASQTDPKAVPDLEQFIDDLRATFETVHLALS